MMVSREEYEALLARVEALEKALAPQEPETLRDRYRAEADEFMSRSRARGRERGGRA